MRLPRLLLLGLLASLAVLSCTLLLRCRESPPSLLEEVENEDEGMDTLGTLWPEEEATLAQQNAYVGTPQGAGPEKKDESATAGAQPEPTPSSGGGGGRLEEPRATGSGNRAQKAKDNCIRWNILMRLPVPIVAQGRDSALPNVGMFTASIGLQNLGKLALLFNLTSSQRMGRAISKNT